MYHHTDLKIRGNISKKLCKNLTWYVQKFLRDFSKELTPAKIFVDGFAPTIPTGNIIGTGISCGVSEDKMRELALNRADPGKQVAAELGLPYHYLNSNLHTFRKPEDLHKVTFISLYSCALSLSNVVSKYYMSNSTNYKQISTDLIIDGCQYRRVDKLKNIVDWNIAKKYLNVCRRYTPDGSNCGRCPKCLRTLLPLEILGKLDDYAKVFDIKQYKNASFGYKIHCQQNYGKNPFETENVDFARENNFPMPMIDKK